ncbi:hypothetical protein D9758_004795 [Tetrapyrgos nigripes]|uniref:Fe2OG dioxygenase domain-containing protein n=1 Tax=Tetrapyrgos nigripes TaxID=182062 RepID=A0A8H5G6G0_9AGAR|nr:hypothetical protein D9758_004795 [Tetrapyrgos nigripes]
MARTKQSARKSSGGLAPLRRIPTMLGASTIPKAPEEGHTTEDAALDADEAMVEDFKFKGSFASGDAYPNAPNPVLTIDGIGRIGLPLTDRDAQLIMDSENSRQAPFGHNQETVVDTKVRDTFEIDASKVHFKNPQFETWLKEQVLRKVTTELGTEAQVTTSVELYKLLLYKTGSHFAKHQDTQKQAGMYGSLIILLPSEYTGGELILTHSDTSKIFDFSNDSLFSCVAMAWYTDVFHEVKPVTSGYRLALSFNLVRSSNPSVPLPRLPDLTRGIEAFRKVLNDWKENQHRLWDTAAYILDHQYSESELREGVKGLKGQDAQLLAHVREVAEDTGFVLALGNLDLHESGAPDDAGYGWNKRGRYAFDSEDDDDDDDEEVGMLEVYESELNGALVPDDYFEDKEPDDKEYEGYMGNEGGQLDQYYYATALVIINGDEPNFARPYKGERCLRRLRESSSAESSEPTPTDRTLAYGALNHIPSLDCEKEDTLVHFACLWKDVSYLGAIFKRMDIGDSMFHETLFEIWKVFGWDVMSTLLENELPRLEDLVSVDALLDNLEKHACDKENSKEEAPVVQEWCKRMFQENLLRYKEAYDRDVPILLRVIRERGMEWFMQQILPNFVKDPRHSVYKFWSRLVEALLDNGLGIYSETRSLDASSPAMDTTVDPPQKSPLLQCLEILIGLWNAQGRHVGEEANVSDQIVQIVHLCVRAKHPDLCTPLFMDLLSKRRPSPDTFETVYEKIIRGLQTWKD